MIFAPTIGKRWWQEVNPVIVSRIAANWQNTPTRSKRQVTTEGIEYSSFSAL
jgi:hypothetical protein